jgi:DNA-binding YbaB/EbfC family protein
MFGQLGQLMQLLSNPEKLKADMQAMQERLAAARYVGESGGGQVRVTVDGKADVIEFKIEPALISGGDHELIEDLCAAAARAATQLSRRGLRKKCNR